MPRRARRTPGGTIFHVLNRGAGKLKLFGRPNDYEAFEELIADAMTKANVDVLAYCVMPNHWHFVLRPKDDGDLSRFMFWLTMTHVQRWRHARRLVGLGPLYQGRFKAFAVEDDRHFLTVARYVERNAAKAGLVGKAETWRHGSAWNRSNPGRSPISLTEWPVDRPSGWLGILNEVQSESEVNAIRSRVRSGRPFGSAHWEQATAKRLGILPIGKAGRPIKSRK